MPDVSNLPTNTMRLSPCPCASDHTPRAVRADKHTSCLVSHACRMMCRFSSTCSVLPFFPAIGLLSVPVFHRSAWKALNTSHELLFSNSKPLKGSPPPCVTKKRRSSGVCPIHAPSARNAFVKLILSEIHKRIKICFYSYLKFYPIFSMLDRFLLASNPIHSTIPTTPLLLLPLSQSVAFIC